MVNKGLSSPLNELSPFLESDLISADPQASLNDSSKFFISFETYF